MQPTPDIAALIKFAQSPAGQNLLSMLQSRHSTADLNEIAAAAASGKLEEAKQKISNLLSDKDTRDLLTQLEKQL